MPKAGDIIEVKAFKSRAGDKYVCESDKEQSDHTVMCKVLADKVNKYSGFDLIVEPPDGYEYWNLCSGDYGYNGPTTKAYWIHYSAMVDYKPVTYSVGEIVEVPATPTPAGKWNIGGGIGWDAAHVKVFRVEIAQVDDDSVVIKLPDEIPGGYPAHSYDLDSQEGRFWRQALKHVRKIEGSAVVTNSGASCAKCGDYNSYQYAGFVCYSCRQDPWRMRL